MNRLSNKARGVADLRPGSGLLFLVTVLLAGCGGAATREEAPASELTIAAAADLQFALAELAESFRKNHPQVHVKTVLGSSSKLYSQALNQAPFDILLSANVEFPQRLIEQGCGDPDSLFRYARGQIVVWVPVNLPIAVEELGMNSLLHPSVRKIAIANPRHAPYGMAAEAAMRHYGLYEQVHDRLVLAENIAQAAQFVESGAADVGIIARSLAVAPGLRDKGRYWLVPLDAYPPLEQAGVILSRTRNRGAAEAWRNMMTGREGREILRRHGFLVSEE
ncbi:MAG: molybdate ABC transporter substrate-binding protein [Gemmatales bacterium]|nr:molybdate ABC transporter substrate-binding protein [Gemmatales bacterium]MDW8386292.1 molybdate ABC transporter substrate-binding protein [Gemmatales bacterium]